MEKITILANRLAESVLFDWDKEEVIKLAKEVAVACKENIDFTCLVKRMREAQDNFTILDGRLTYKVNSGVKVDEKDYQEHSDAMYKMMTLEGEVDEYLKEMEE